MGLAAYYFVFSVLTATLVSTILLGNQNRETMAKSIVIMFMSWFPLLLALLFSKKDDVDGNGPNAA